MFSYDISEMVKSYSKKVGSEYAILNGEMVEMYDVISACEDYIYETLDIPYVDEDDVLIEICYFFNEMCRPITPNMTCLIEKFEEVRLIMGKFKELKYDIWEIKEQYEQKQLELIKSKIKDILKLVPFIDYEINIFCEKVNLTILNSNDDKSSLVEDILDEGLSARENMLVDVEFLYVLE